MRKKRTQRTQGDGIFFRYGLDGETYERIRQIVLSVVRYKRIEGIGIVLAKERKTELERKTPLYLDKFKFDENSKKWVYDDYVSNLFYVRHYSNNGTFSVVFNLDYQGNEYVMEVSSDGNFKVLEGSIR
jgi:hypothetical protein